MRYKALPARGEGAGGRGKRTGGAKVRGGVMVSKSIDGQTEVRGVHFFFSS